MAAAAVMMVVIDHREYIYMHGSGSRSRDPFVPSGAGCVRIPSRCVSSLVQNQNPDDDAIELACQIEQLHSIAACLDA